MEMIRYRMSQNTNMHFFEQLSGLEKFPSSNAFALAYLVSLREVKSFMVSISLMRICFLEM